MLEFSSSLISVTLRLALVWAMYRLARSIYPDDDKRENDHGTTHQILPSMTTKIDHPPRRVGENIHRDDDNHNEHPQQSHQQPQFRLDDVHSQQHAEKSHLASTGLRMEACPSLRRSLNQLSGQHPYVAKKTIKRLPSIVEHEPMEFFSDPNDSVSTRPLQPLGMRQSNKKITNNNCEDAIARMSKPKTQWRANMDKEMRLGAIKRTPKMPRTGRHA